MRNLIKNKQKLEAEYAQPLAAIVRGFIEKDGESINSASKIIGCQPADLEDFVRIHGIASRRKTLNPMARHVRNLGRDSVNARRIAMRCRCSNTPRRGYRLDRIEYQGKRLMPIEWAESLGHRGPDARRVADLFRKRIARGYSVSAALTTPIKRRNH